MLVEDDLVTSVALGKVIRKGVPDAMVLSARTLAEARLMLGEYTITFFILDINLPDGSGIDFILDVTKANPDASIVLMTSTPLPEYRDQAEAFGVMNFMPKPVDNQKLVALIKESLVAAQPAGKEEGSSLFGASLSRLKRLVGFSETAPPAPREGDTTFFRASLSRLTVLDIIQLKCLNSITQGIVFKSSKHGVGRVFFQNGDIIHAETERATGMAALSEIIGWKGGQAEEIPDGMPPERTISGRWQNALLIAAHDADDKRMP
jgi:DNA-binding NarL/FixJ family response regulator